MHFISICNIRIICDNGKEKKYRRIVKHFGVRVSFITGKNEEMRRRGFFCLNKCRIVSLSVLKLHQTYFSHKEIALMVFNPISLNQSVFASASQPVKTLRTLDLMRNIKRYDRVYNLLRLFIKDCQNLIEFCPI